MQTVLESARRTFRIEAEALAGLAHLLNHNFVASVEAIGACQRRLVIGEVGKSALVGKKIVASLGIVPIDHLQAALGTT